MKTDLKTGAEFKSRTARTVNVLRDAIVHAQFAPGEKLLIDRLGKTYGASIGAVREALSRLTAEGLVVAEPQKGFVVAPISRKDLLDLTEVRIEIECRCMAQSIAQGDLDWEGRVLSLQHKLRALDGAWRERGTARASQWHDLHRDFHDELAGGCRNDWWRRLRVHLFVQSERYRRLSGPIEADGRDITAEHDAIADAALVRDSDAAQRMMDAHLRRTTEIILASSLPFVDDTSPDQAGAGVAG